LNAAYSNDPVLQCKQVDAPDHQVAPQVLGIHVFAIATAGDDRKMFFLHERYMPLTRSSFISIAVQSRHAGHRNFFNTQHRRPSLRSQANPTDNALLWQGIQQFLKSFHFNGVPGVLKMPNPMRLTALRGAQA
jgi:hypothetical protein